MYNEATKKQETSAKTSAQECRAENSFIKENLQYTAGLYSYGR